jgi:DNA gyrase/topoisomerase IV subunit A
MNAQEILKKLTEIQEEVNTLKSNVENATANFKLTDEQINKIARSVAKSISYAGENIVDDYDLSMTHREVELSDITFSERKLMEFIEDALKETIEELVETEAN